MGHARGDHHPRPLPLRQLAEQQTGKRKCAQMIDAKLRFKPVGRFFTRRHHDPGIVQQHIEPRLRRHQFRGSANRLQVAQVQRHKTHVGFRIDGANIRHRRLRPFRRPATEQHPRAPAGKQLGSLVTQSAVRAGHEKDAPALVGHVHIGEIADRHAAGLLVGFPATTKTGSRAEKRPATVTAARRRAGC